MLLLQKTILEMIARGVSLNLSMERLGQELERRIPSVACSVDRVDAAGLLRPVAGPRLAIDISQKIDGIPGLRAGPCGLVVVQGQAIFLSRPEADPRWGDLKTSAANAGYVGCWSYPIAGGGGRILGALSFYLLDGREPSAAEISLGKTCADLCAIAMERHERVAEREYRASHDELTGLANRSAFNELLARLSCAEPGSWALMAIDLDNLKPVNDTYGHHVGDCLLKIAAERLSEAAAPDRVFRIGGDEFMIVLQGDHSLGDPDGTAGRLLDRLGLPADCAGFRINPQASLGCAVLATGDDIPETVRQNADHALYCAKETNRGGYVRYWPGLGSPITERIRQIREIEGALREGRVTAWYQPIISLENGDVAGLEAFCRITTQNGHIKPAAAFDLSDSDAQVAYELTRRMLEIVAEDSAEWLGQKSGPGFLAINLSSADLRVPGLTKDLLTILAEREMPAHRLVLDLNETTHLGLRDAHALAVIRELRSSGIRIALDDFGSGLASLSHLMSVPVDQIKLDPSLTGVKDDEGKAEAIISGMLDISRRLGIEVIAEAVETETQNVWLQSLGCRLAQGFYFSRPLPQSEMNEWLIRRVHSSPLQIRALRA